MNFILDNICGGVCMCRNVVSTVNLDCKVDLKAVALHARNAEYNPKVWNVWWDHNPSIYKNF